MSTPSPEGESQTTSPSELTVHDATPPTVPCLLLSSTPMPEVKDRFDMGTTDTFIESGE